MPLVTRGRLSVQSVSEECWGIIQMMAGNGGWEQMTFGKKKSGASNAPKKPSRKMESTDDDHGNTVGAEVGSSEDIVDDVKLKKGKKRKASEVDQGNKGVPLRRSVRTKKEG